MELWNILVRAFTTLSLMTAFGFTAFFAYSGFHHPQSTEIRRKSCRTTGFLVFFAVIMSFAGLLQMGQSFAGAPSLLPIDIPTLQMVLSGTDVGKLWIVRIVALSLALCLLWPGFSPRSWQNSAMSFVLLVALGTMAWAGHAAMNDGLEGKFHLASDVLHLVFGGLWLGALVAFLFVIAWCTRQTDKGTATRQLARAARRFSSTGTLIVGILIPTGLFNYWMTSGLHLPDVASDLYDRLFAIKLFCFVAMLSLAALNRFRLTPALLSLQSASLADASLRSFRNSLLLETGLAVSIVSLVAWFGSISP